MTSPPFRTGAAIRAVAAKVDPAARFGLAAGVAAGPRRYEIPALHRVYDQGALPACVSCALSVAMESLHPSGPELSPVFHYHVTRYENDGADSDGALFVERGLATLAKQGICRHELHLQPSTDGGAAAPPSQDARDDGLSRKLQRRGRLWPWKIVSGVSRAGAIRDELDRDRPVAITFRLPATYPGSFLDARFEWTDPSVALALNAHCVLVVGYSDSRAVLRIQDSRGSGSFDGGFWWMGYGIAESSIVLSAHCLTG